MPSEIVKGPTQTDMHRAGRTCVMQALVVLCYLVAVLTAAVPAKAGLVPEGTSWTVSVYTHTSRDPYSGFGLKLYVLPRETGRPTAGPFDLNKMSKKEWRLEKEIYPGRIISGSIKLPTTLSAPGALFLSKNLPAKASPGQEALEYVARVELSSGGRKFIFPAHSWVSSVHGNRTFFDGTAFLPSQTPPALKKLRAAELAVLRGDNLTPAQRAAQRQGADRVYDYAIVRDLGNDTTPGPVLGGPELPYPRHLRTNRPINPKTGQESQPPKGVPAWNPYDEAFDYTRAVWTGGNAVAFEQQAGIQVEVRKGYADGSFKSFKDVYAVFGPTFVGKPTDLKQVEAAYKQASTTVTKLATNVRGAVDELEKKSNGWGPGRAASGVKPGQVMTDDLARRVAINWRLPAASFDKAISVAEEAGPRSLQGVANLDEPEIVAARSDEVAANLWRSDREFGYSFVSGQNPVMITTVNSTKQLGTIKDKDVAGVLPKGTTLASLIKQATTAPRLFTVDYYTDIIAAVPLVNKQGGRHQYAGRVVLFLNNAGYLLPIAIELGDDPKGAPRIFTPNPKQTPPQLWQLAKAAFLSIDSTVHQAYNHYTRAHAAQVAFILPTKRQLSIMHPISKLLQPHFANTIHITEAAHQGLIAVGGVVEMSFTTGALGMVVASTLYGKWWRFDRQGLRADLKARGMLNSKGELLLKDYPFAEDGLAIYDVMQKWMRDYVNMYYKTDAEITADNELQAWWKEIQTKGHPDKKEGWPRCATRAELADILTTMAWIGSGHHSAINFNQYDFSSLLTVRSTFMRRPIPQPGSKEAQVLADPKRFESEFLTYLATPRQSLTSVGLIRHLSMHSRNERYLTDREHPFITDQRALTRLQVFVNELKAAQTAMLGRNAKGRTSAGTRSHARTKADEGMAYTTLLLEAQPGQRNKGVPYGTTI